MIPFRSGNFARTLQRVPHVLSIDSEARSRMTWIARILSG